MIDQATDVTLEEMTEATETGQPFKYRVDEVLTADQVAEWLGISTKTLPDLNIPEVRLRPRMPRYLAGDVYNWLRSKSKKPLLELPEE